MQVFQSTIYCVLILTSLGLGVTRAQAQSEVNSSAASSVTTEASDLDAADLRKLAFFADKMLAELTDLASVEDRGDVSAITGKLKVVQSSAQRFTTSARAASLSPEATTQFFQNHFVENFHGRLPLILVGSTGNIDFDVLLFGDVQDLTPNGTQSDDYIDLLRIEGSE